MNGLDRDRKFVSPNQERKTKGVFGAKKENTDAKVERETEVKAVKNFDPTENSGNI